MLEGEGFPGRYKGICGVDLIACEGDLVGLLQSSQPKQKRGPGNGNVMDEGATGGSESMMWRYWLPAEHVSKIQPAMSLPPTSKIFVDTRID